MNILVPDPRTIKKYLYIERTPTLYVRMLYVCGLIGWILVLWGFSGAIRVDPFYAWVVAPLLGIFTLYHGASFCLNSLYRQFDLSAHAARVRQFWGISEHETEQSASPPQRDPSVDVFLPICGEDIAILKNTWEHVARLAYMHTRVYVLDDSHQHTAEHKLLAEQFGFSYFERPNKGEMKKAGNLKYAYERTSGEFIAIFDADFAPHPDFLLELLPYASDTDVGIIQSPQYFTTTKEMYARSPLAYAAAYHEELFYRVIQVARDTFGAAICCGTNALYRRRALEDIGGPRQVDASEDSRTGFAMNARGWRVKYVPVILAIGACPDTMYAYFHQQHRWCRGRTSLVLSKEFFTARVPFLLRLSNISGFLSFIGRPLTIVLSFQLFWVLYFYNDYISFSNAAVFYPYIVFALVAIPFFHIARPRLAIFYASIIQLYASTHALFGVFFKRPSAWIATGGSHSSISPAFRQTFLLLSVYIAVYVFLFIIAALAGLIRIFDLDYYSIQFWLFYNLFLSLFLYARMRTHIKTASQQLKDR